VVTEPEVSISQPAIGQDSERISTTPNPLKLLLKEPSYYNPQYLLLGFPNGCFPRDIFLKILLSISVFRTLNVET
jgi:hypothetical protein